MNLADAVSFQARRRPHAVALIQDALTLSFANLDRAVWRAVAALREQALAPGDVVGVAMTNYILHVVTVLALARLGAVSVGFPAKMGEPRRKALVEKFRPKAVVAFNPDRRIEGLPWIRADPEWMAPRGIAVERFALPDGRGKPWRLGLSFGAGGALRGIPLLHDRSLQQALLQQTLVAGAGEARFLCSTDLATAAGLGPCLRHLIAGNAVVMLNEESAEKFLAAVDRHGVTQAFVTQGLLATLAQESSGGELRCPGLAGLGIEGAALPRELREAVLSGLTPNLYSSYSVPEAGLVALAEPRIAVRFPGAAGRVVPWMEVQVVDERDALLAPDTPGRLRLRGLGLFDGYFEDPEASAGALREGWFYPGDRARMSAGGLLFVEARTARRPGQAKAALAAPAPGR